jgi:hypothetical protein
MHLAHWLMISGGLMVVVGFVGLSFARNRDVASDPDELPEQQTSDVEAQVDEERLRGDPTAERPFGLSALRKLKRDE